MKKILASFLAAGSIALADPLMAQEKPDCNTLDSIVRPFIKEDSEVLNVPVLDEYVPEEAKMCLPMKVETPFGVFVVTKANFYQYSHTWYEIKKVNTQE